MKRNGATPPMTSKAIRCAIYTRKSTEEGLEQEFNSLDAQRESGEAYIRSQVGEGWTLLLDRYDDGGFTGGNMDRPALKRLMADIVAGKVDVVVVYKVDRLSRSLLDFARMMQAFEEHKVAFVSVTQQFNTGSSMGRLVLNVLLSFAQFEREIISERTRDKIAATRRKGKWAGGHPILGYDVDPANFKLLVNDTEAERVRAIFDLYLEHESLLPVVQELERRGWRNKRWQTRKAGERGGKAFDRTSLYRLLTNPAYTGKVKYKDELHAGEHTSIITPAIFDKVQALLRRNGSTGGAIVRNQHRSLLQGLLRCGPCGCAMTPTHTTRGGSRRYRYYVCSSAQRRGRRTCPSKSVPAGPVEDFVIERVRCIGRDPALQEQVLAEAARQDEGRVVELQSEEKSLQRELADTHAELKRLSGQLRRDGDNTAVVARLAELNDRMIRAEERLEATREELRRLGSQGHDAGEAARTLSGFDSVWGSLTPGERARVIDLLVERVVYDGSSSRIEVAFRPTGIRTLAEELESRWEEAA
ncbi:MAG: recombinase family protein [Gemmataceae bacterium]